MVENQRQRKDKHPNVLVDARERMKITLLNFYSPTNWESIIEMTVHFDLGEEFVLHRLEREKRHGTVELLDSQTCRFSADVYDASEMLPWLRTFIGRIVDLKCSSQYVLDMFQEDLARMDALYGGGDDVIQ